MRRKRKIDDNSLCFLSVDEMDALVDERVAVELYYKRLRNDELKEHIRNFYRSRKSSYKRTLK